MLLLACLHLQFTRIELMHYSYTWEKLESWGYLLIRPSTYPLPAPVSGWNDWSQPWRHSASERGKMAGLKLQ
jgi:hypothetical protein